MNPKETNSENDQRNNRIMNFIRAHEWRRLLLTWFALTLGVLTILVGIGLAMSYSLLIEPRVHGLQEDYSQYNQHGQVANNTATTTSAADSKSETYQRNRDRYHVGVAHVLGVESMWIGGAVALLGVGMLITALLIVVTRRVTLRQINESLVKISNQIKELENR